LQLSSFLLCFTASDPAPIFMVIYGWAKQLWVNSKLKVWSTWPVNSDHLTDDHKDGYEQDSN
jgi:hypothetical protein